MPLHVLVWGVDESHWADMDRLRGNLYELLDYIGRRGDSPARSRTRSTGWATS